jgi:hypothetical protein
LQRTDANTATLSGLGVLTDPDKREYRLKINAYSRDTMPMKRLAEYLTDMATLLGEESHVHLIAIESGCTCPVFLVDWEAEPKVMDRLEKAKRGEGPDDPRQAIVNINTRLRKDNASADLLNPLQSKVIEFPGATIDQPIEWPFINQAAELYGVPFWVGGRADLSNVHLLDGNREWPCLAERSKAISIAQHLYVSTLRVSGRGEWRKEPGGAWKLERFVIEEFEPIAATTVEQTIRDLRSIKAKWKSLSDPLAGLDAIRTGEDSDSDGGLR